MGRKSQAIEAYDNLLNEFNKAAVLVDYMHFLTLDSKIDIALSIGRTRLLGMPKSDTDFMAAFNAYFRLYVAGGVKALDDEVIRAVLESKERDLIFNMMIAKVVEQTEASLEDLVQVLTGLFDKFGVAGKVDFKDWVCRFRLAVVASGHRESLELARRLLSHLNA